MVVINESYKLLTEMIVNFSLFTVFIHILIKKCSLGVSDKESVRCHRSKLQIAHKFQNEVLLFAHTSSTSRSVSLKKLPTIFDECARALP